MSEPTLGEVLRRLDEVSRQLVSLAEQMQRDRDAAERLYLRKDVYAAERGGAMQRLEDLERDADAKEKAQDQFRRQVFAGLILAAIPALFGLILAVNTFLATGGQTP